MHSHNKQVLWGPRVGIKWEKKLSLPVNEHCLQLGESVKWGPRVGIKWEKKLSLSVNEHCLQLGESVKWRTSL